MPSRPRPGANQPPPRSLVLQPLRGGGKVERRLAEPASNCRSLATPKSQPLVTRLNPPPLPECGQTWVIRAPWVAQERALEDILRLLSV